MDSFLLVGQSNMAGRGLIDEAIAVDESLIKVYRNGIWRPMFRPINFDLSSAGVSLAERFAECHAKKVGSPVGLIGCAVGNTSVAQWQPGEVLFDNAVNCARIAMRSSTLKGILWHQGEADSMVERLPFYHDGLVNVIRSFREALDLPEVPFILGGLGDFFVEHVNRNDKDRGCETTINQISEDVAKKLPYCAFVSAKGLQSNPDKLHFSSAALYEFGNRYYKAFELI